MSPVHSASAVPPFVATPSWRRPLRVAAAVALLLAAISIPVARHFQLWGSVAPITADLASLHSPVVTVAAGIFIAYLYILLPVMLLYALFCARLGAERGQALETGMLPGLLLFGVLMFVAGFIQSHLPLRHFVTLSMEMARATPMLTSRLALSPGRIDAFTIGALLLACFAVMRADPPAPSHVGFGWTLAAGALGAWCAYGEAEVLGSVGALGLYVSWSAGWPRALKFALGAAFTVGVTATRASWRHGSWVFSVHSTSPMVGNNFMGSVVALGVTALLGYVLRHRLPSKNPAMSEAEVPPPPPGIDAAITPPHPTTLPVAPARRIIGFLWFITLVSIPSAIPYAMKYGIRSSGGEWVAVILSVSAGLLLTTWLERAGRVAQVVVDTVALTILLCGVRCCIYEYYTVMG